MQILIGALIGGVLSLAAGVVMALIFKRKITAGLLIGSFVGGAIAGAVAGTTFGASLVAGGGVRALSFLAVEGGVSSGTGQVTQNAIDHEPLLTNVVRSTALGAATAPLGFLGGKAALKVLPEAVTGPLGQLAAKLPAPLRAGLGISLPDAAANGAPGVAVAGVAAPLPVTAPPVPVPADLPPETGIDQALGSLQGP